MANIAAIKSKAAEYFQKGDFEKAIKEYERALEIEPTDAIIYNNIGDSYLKLGKSEEAIKAYEKAAEVYSNDALYNNATAVCKKILRISRDTPRVFWRLAELYAHQGLTNDAINNFVQYAEMVQKGGNLDGVLEAYQKIVELSPRNVDIRGKLADLYASQGKTEDAVREFESVIAFYREHGRTHEAEALEAKVRKMTGAAEPPPPPEAPAPKPAEPPPTAFAPPPGFVTSGISFESLFPEVAASPEPQAPEANIEEAAVTTQASAAAAKLPSGAEPVPEEALSEKPPEDWAVSVELGELLLDIGSTQEATEQFHRAAEGYFNSGKLKEARDLYRRIAELQPLEIRTRQKLVEIALKRESREDTIEAYLGLAECLLRRERKEQSTAVYHKVLELDPKNETALENLSLLAPPVAAAAPEEKIPPAAARAPKVEAPPVVATKGPEEHASLSPRLLGEEGGAPEEAIVSPPVAAAPEKPKEPLAPSLLSEGERPPEAGEPIEAEKVALGREIVEGGRKSHVKFAVAESEPTAAAEEALSIGDIIEEFKEGVFKTVSQEDYSSHYDLGIAYKEMGLLEESIMEFQIASKGTAEKLKSLEMLGICFLEKGEPQFAARQLEQGLAIAGHPPEQYLGLHYYLATACERLEDLEGAVKHLEEVYLVDAKFMDTRTRLKNLKAQLKKAPPKAATPPPIEAKAEKVHIEKPSPAPEAMQPAPEEAPVAEAEDFLSTVSEMLKTVVSPPSAEAAPSVPEPAPEAVGQPSADVEGPLPKPVSPVAEVPPPTPEPIPEPEAKEIPAAPAPEKPRPEPPKKRKISYV